MWQILSAVLYIMNLSLAIYVAYAMVLRKSDPVKTLTWVTVLIMLPYLGLFLYLFLGQNVRKKKLYSRKGNAEYKIRRKFSASQLQAINKDEAILGESLQFRKIIYQNLNNSYTVLEHNSNINFYFTGRDALDAMYKEIESAKKHIHLQSYIFEDDIIGKKFADLLIKKAKEGVEVRVIVDGLGSISLKEAFIGRLRSAGVEVLLFAKVRFPIPTIRINYRNHRKILVIDGVVGFLGGVNIADRYYYGTPSGDWHDTHIRVVGESVASLQASFLLDRYFILNKRIRKRGEYYPNIENHILENKLQNSLIAAQTVISGPDSNWASIMQCFFSAITMANESIYIVTPYFTPNETILNAIKIAALGNIKVNIMLPEVSDSKLIHYSTRSYIAELLEAGVNIYLFKQGFNHSKVIAIDNKFAIVGSANMDVRSFEHNFEILTVIYDEQSTKIITEHFKEDCNLSLLLTKSRWDKRDKREKVAESFARLCTPLL